MTFSSGVGWSQSMSYFLALYVLHTGLRILHLWLR